MPQATIISNQAPSSQTPLLPSPNCPENFADKASYFGTPERKLGKDLNPVKFDLLNFVPGKSSNDGSTPGRLQHKGPKAISKIKTVASPPGDSMTQRKISGFRSCLPDSCLRNLLEHATPFAGIPGLQILAPCSRLGLGLGLRSRLGLGLGLKVMAMNRKLRGNKTALLILNFGTPQSFFCCCSSFVLCSFFFLYSFYFF